MKKFFMKHRVSLMLLALVAVSSMFGLDICASTGLLVAFAGVTTTDLTAGSGIPANKTDRFFVLRDRITIPLALQVASDVVQVLNVKAGWLVRNVRLLIVTPTTGTAVAVNVGDGDGTSSYDAAVSLAAAAATETHGVSGTDAYITADGKYYAADDTIDFVFSTVTVPAGAIVVDVIAECVDLNA